MDIYEYLQKDHKKVNNLFKQILMCDNAKERTVLLETLEEQLLVHAITEAETFYAALKKHKTMKDKIDHAEEEHAEIRRYITRLRKLKANEDSWLEQLGEFKYAVTHHVKEEEGEIFDGAKKVLTDKQAIDLAAQMEQLKHAKLNKAAA